MTPRKYDQRLRAESAEETRRRILDAVYERLRSAPTEPISLDRIARMAGVSRSTIYLVFGSRSGLFEGLVRDLVERAGYQDLLRAVSHPDAREHMRGGIRAGAKMFAAEYEVYRTLFSMGPLDPESVGAAVRNTENERTKGMARLAKRLREDGVLRPGVTEKEAAHMLWVITSFEAFDLLYTGRGLSVDRAADVLIEMAEGAVIRPRDLVAKSEES